MDNVLLVMLVLVIFIPTSFIVTIIPYLTRKTESFGISVTEEVHALPINRKLRKQYAMINGMISALLTISISALTFTLEPEPWSIALMIHVFAIAIISFIIYLKYHFTVKRLKQEKGWTTPGLSQRIVVDTAFHSKKVVHSAWWFAPQVLIMLLTVVTGVLFYDRFPDLIAMHYNTAGEVTRYAEKSYLTVLWPAAVQASMIALMVFGYYAIARSKQQIDAADPEASLQRNIIFRRRWSAFMLILGTLLQAMFYLIQLATLLELGETFITAVSLGFIAISLVYAIWLSISTGQGGSRIKINGERAKTAKVNVDDDKYWKLGQFYFNPNDPSLFIEKRFGVGWTFNTARPLAWIILLSIIAIPILITIFLP